MACGRNALEPVRGLEQLEPRLLLSGDVGAILAGTTLKLTGDAADNDFTVDGISGDVVVTGNSTTLNGGGGPLVFMGVKSIQIKLTDGGNDTVLVTDVDLEGKIDIKGGAGDNGIQIINSMVDKDVRVQTGDGADTVQVLNTDVGTNLRVDVRDGVDLVQAISTVGKNVDIKTKGAADNNLSFVGSAGGNLSMRGADGDDTVLADTLAVTKNVKIDGRTGSDNITVDDGTVGGNLDIRARGETGST
ncbi:MAG: LEPR-XLL domain-containing protein, partial [Phycisphaerae bacterium]|nr:LEPR-XLL domain-containing protein [Phycisphaerae bacterium]